MSCCPHIIVLTVLTVLTVLAVLTVSGLERIHNRNFRNAPQVTPLDVPQWLKCAQRVRAECAGISKRSGCRNEDKDAS